MKILIGFLILLIGLLLLNLYLTIENVQYSFVYWLSDFDGTAPIDRWALRGQIGDILSGHFSALAFLAVGLSIILQNEANKQMRESIDKQEEALKQQSEALMVQSNSLEAQIEELKASKSEFALNNLNLKLDRYYNLLDKNIEIMCPYDRIDVVQSLIDKKVSNKPLNEEEKFLLQSLVNQAMTLFNILELIYRDSHFTHKKCGLKENIFINEFSIKINSEPRIPMFCLLIDDKSNYSFLHKLQTEYQTK